MAWISVVSQIKLPFVKWKNFRHNDTTNWQRNNGGGRMKDLVNGQSLLDTSVTEVVHALCTISDELLPHLKPAEQIVYLRLFRLSYMRQNPYTRCRYEDIATQCGISLRTLQRALKGLRQKKLVSTVWQSHGATTFSVQNYAVLTYRPAFLPRRRRNPGFEPLTPPKTRPPIYDAFSR